MAFPSALKRCCFDVMLVMEIAGRSVCRHSIAMIFSGHMTTAEIIVRFSLGREPASDKFVIRSSQARSKKRDQPDYLTISINSPNLHEALLSGKFGGERGGNSWWEKCLMSTQTATPKRSQ